VGADGKRFPHDSRHTFALSLGQQPQAADVVGRIRLRADDSKDRRVVLGEQVVHSAAATRDPQLTRRRFDRMIRQLSSSGATNLASDIRRLHDGLGLSAVPQQPPAQEILVRLSAVQHRQQVDSAAAARGRARLKLFKGSHDVEVAFDGQVRSNGGVLVTFAARASDMQAIRSRLKVIALADNHSEKILRKPGLGKVVFEDGGQFGD
jgi:hypothetical protein